MNKTGISWTDLTWNPVTGCSKVSPGCKNCYAEALYKRHGFDFSPRFHEEKLKQVRSISPGSKVFVNSTSDLFHEFISYSDLEKVFEAMQSRPDVIFQVLTKRPELAQLFFDIQSGNLSFEVPSNLWLGVSVEMAEYRERIDILKGLPSETKFVSFEPLLGPIGKVDLSDIDWIIIGGESGPNHRLMKIEWAKDLIDQAREQGASVWMKQLGGFRPGGDLEDFPEELRVQEFPGVKA